MTTPPVALLGLLQVPSSGKWVGLGIGSANPSRRKQSFWKSITGINKLNHLNCPLGWTVFIQNNYDASLWKLRFFKSHEHNILSKNQSNYFLEVHRVSEQYGERKNWSNRYGNGKIQLDGAWNKWKPLDSSWTEKVKFSRDAAVLRELLWWFPKKHV